jgi:isoquinoline 1-oxidoreductase subunit beta
VHRRPRHRLQLLARRGPGYLKFRIETLVDEVATVAAKDPLQIPAGHVGKAPRAQAVLREVARWPLDPGAPGRACARPGVLRCLGHSFIGMVVEASIKDGKPGGAPDLGRRGLRARR